MATATAEKNVEAKPRQGGGKNDARRLRKSGLIPAVVYGAGQDRSPLPSIPSRCGASCTRNRDTTPFSISLLTADAPR